MAYVWIFATCYVVAFVFVTLRLAAERARSEAHAKALGMSVARLRANFRAQLPLAKDIAIRLWSPLVLSFIPSALISVAYFVFA